MWRGIGNDDEDELEKKVRMYSNGVRGRVVREWGRTGGGGAEGNAAAWGSHSLHLIMLFSRCDVKCHGVV